MSGVALSFAFDSAPIRLHLARLALLNGHKFKRVRQRIGAFMLGDIQDNLDDQKLFDGPPMPQSKAAIARRGKTLIREHHLYDSYVYQLDGAGVAVGSNKVYAAIHHFGGVTGRGHKTNILARPVLGLGPRQQDKIGDFLIDAIKALEP